MNKLYIGIDPDVRLLSAAIVTSDKKLAQVFLRRNNGAVGESVISNAARKACELVADVIAYLVVEETLKFMEIVLVVESQSMMHTKAMRAKGKKVNYEDIRKLAQVTGCLMAAFSNMSTSIHLLPAMTWKKNTPTPILHNRIYQTLDINIHMKGGQDQYGVPDNFVELSSWSGDKVNAGDFKDISDSIGLALYGAKKGL